MDPRLYDVVIIGAGAAGLAAAATIAATGRSLLVLEARDRLGGRIWTRHEPGVAAPIELGAEFLHGHATEAVAHLRQAGSAAVELTEHHLSLHGGELQPRTGFQQVVEAIRHDKTLKRRDMSLDEYLDEHLRDVLPVEAREYARMLAEGFDAADTARASARALAEEWTSDMLGDAPQSRPAGGYDTLLSYLA